MRYYLLLLFIGVLYVLPAQESPLTAISAIATYREKMLAEMKNISRKINNYKADHDHFLNKNWQQSTVITEDGEYLHFSGRYNILRNALEANVEEEIYSINPSKIKAAMIGNRLLIPLSGELVEEGNFSLLFEVISAGDVTLLQRFKVDSRMQGNGSAIVSISEETVYFVRSDFYYTTDFTSLTLLRRNKKRILELFGDQQSKMEQYMDKNGLKLRKDEDIIALFKQFNAQ